MTYTNKDLFTYSNMRSGYVRGPEPMSLSWYLYYDSISDDYTFEDADARELWSIWLRRINWEATAETYGLPLGTLPIWWLVEPAGEGLGRFGAVDKDDDDEDFLTFFTWPTHTETGERLQWSRLPVDDKVWTADRWEKGGFIQEATGWKPSPLQSTVDVVNLARAAGLPGPEFKGA